LIRYRDWHIAISGDDDFYGPQKLHQEVTPRIGGLGIALGFLAASFVGFFVNPTAAKSLGLIALAASPVFATGMVEDFTKRMGVKARLVAAFISGAMFLFLFDVSSIRLDIPIVDSLIAYPSAAVLFLVFAIAGLSNAYNIIDGLNGLASMVGIIALAAILYVALEVQDPIVISLALITIGSVAGFFLWNYPKGLIFLGDGGAYLIGFLIAIASILLVVRHPSVSPWFALMVNAYPIFETLFTIWRRVLHQGRHPALPDGAHLHSLIYRRVMRGAYHDRKLHQYLRNAKTSPCLWLLSSLGVIPAILWWQSTSFLMASASVFMMVYVYLYRTILTFKVPMGISNRRRTRGE
jgi:UDP-N-acetylmuramyl pentapeptide phosphotransferase/UDP-N-acetylglucosamine-1-phosphate transferase